jgi:hypothetical protein
MEKKTGHEAALPNPALAPLQPLTGEWTTIGSHPLIPHTTLHGRCSFHWIEGGAFLMWKSEVDEPGIPSGIAIFGSDEATHEIFMLYFDERKASRKYDVAAGAKTIRWWRNAHGFSQRYSWTIAENGDTLIGKGELSRDGTHWEKDLEQTFSRVR